MYIDIDFRIYYTIIYSKINDIGNIKKIIIIFEGYHFNQFFKVIIQGTLEKKVKIKNKHKEILNFKTNLKKSTFMK